MRMRSRARELVLADREHRRREPDDPRDRQQQQDPHAHREPEADRPRPVPLRGGQALDEDRDEDDVVDPQHDLEEREGEQGDPGLGVGEQFHDAEGIGATALRAQATTDRHYHHQRMTTRSLPGPRHRAAGTAPAGPRDAARARRRAPRGVPARAARPARVLRLDARLPDEQERLRGDGRAPARRRAAPRRRRWTPRTSS